MRRTRWLVVEPHMDDAALSLGGALLSRSNNIDVHVVTVVGRSSYTLPNRHHPAWEVESVSAARERETQQAMTKLRAEHSCLQWSDAPLRLNPDTSWSPQQAAHLMNQWLMSQTWGPEAADIARLAAELERVVAKVEPHVVWVPMGLGEHVDHALARQAGLTVAREHEGDVQFRLYEDVPYAALFPRHADNLVRVLDRAGIASTRHELVVARRADKLRVLSDYKSQIDLDAWDGLIGNHERYWDVSVPSTCMLPAPHRLAPDYNAMHRSLMRLRQRCETAVLSLGHGPDDRLAATREAFEMAFADHSRKCLHPAGTSDLANGRAGLITVVSPSWYAHSRKLVRLSTKRTLFARGLGTLTYCLRELAQAEVYGVDEV